MTNPMGKGGFQRGQSGNPNGRPKLPAEMLEMFQTKAPHDGVSCVRIHAPERKKCEGAGVVAQMAETSPAVSGAAAILHSAQGSARGP